MQIFIGRNGNITGGYEGPEAQLIVPLGMIHIGGSGGIHLGKF